MEGHSVISPEVVARYAADAAHARSTASAASSRACGRAIRVDGDEIELHLALAWGVSIPAVGAAVQQHVADYLERMTDVRPAVVNVVVDEIDGAA